MKKCLSIILAVLMLILPMSVITSAAEDTTVGYSAKRVVKVDVSSYPDIKEYDSNKTATTFKVTDRAGMDKIASLVNAGTDKFTGDTIYMANDIDLEGYQDSTGHHNRWTGIGLVSDSSKRFEGTFDGQGYTINRMWIRVDAVSYANSANVGYGLFVRAHNATVKNLVIGNDSRVNVQGDASHNIDNANLRVGAIIGQADQNVLVYNCWNQAFINGRCAEAGGYGGMIGWVNDKDNTVENCTNTGYIHSRRIGGGMIGTSAGNGTKVKNCRNVGTVWAGAPGAMVGRHRSGNITIDGCINNGTLQDNATVYGSGGMIAEYRSDSGYTLTITDCTNYGKITVATDITNTLTDNDLVILERGILGNLVNNNGGTSYTSTGNTNKEGQPDSSVDPTDVVLSTLLDGSYSTKAIKNFFHGVQRSTVVSDKYSLRFIGSIENLNYAYVGFEVVASWNDGANTHTYEKTATSVFESLIAEENSGMKVYTAHQLIGASGYLYAFTIDNIPVSAGEITFTVKPYKQGTADVGFIYGTAYTVVYNAGEFVSITAA